MYFSKDALRDDFYRPFFYAAGYSGSPKFYSLSTI